MKKQKQINNKNFLSKNYYWYARSLEKLERINEAQDYYKVVVNCTGTLEDGSIFDSSLKPGGTPFTFTLGVGSVIKGWDLGIKGMKVGGKRKLTIPSDLGYGDKGAGNVISPGATLIFEVELLEVEVY